MTFRSGKAKPYLGFKKLVVTARNERDPGFRDSSGNVLFEIGNDGSVSVAGILTSESDALVTGDLYVTIKGLLQSMWMGFYFRNHLDLYYEKYKHLALYKWVWKDGHGTGVCLTLKSNV
jgi:hypothetical protein